MALALAFAVLASLTVSASAFTEPGLTGTAADFSNCPVLVIAGNEQNNCVHAYTMGGSVHIGRATVPITVPGDTFDFGEFKAGSSPCGLAEPTGCVLAPPHGVINGPAQPIPGGVLGTIGNVQLTGVAGQLEWATAPMSGTSFGTFGELCNVTDPLITFDECRLISGSNEPGATLKVRIHLQSPFLGSHCYIGTAGNPIVIALTSGITNPPPPATPIHGKAFEAIHIRSGGFEVSGATLVSNSFAVPAAVGCGITGGALVDQAIDQKVGLPSPAGRNTIIINATAELAGAQFLLAHGWRSE
jgi:hypothetical protein